MALLIGQQLAIIGRRYSRDILPVCVEAIGINKVIHALPEGDETAHSDKGDGEDLWDPCYRWKRRPGCASKSSACLCAHYANRHVLTKPEECYRENESRQYHRRQAFLGDWSTIFQVGTLVVGRR
jgi:hypothetical protein